jgi:hypothetical protein
MDIERALDIVNKRAEPKDQAEADEAWKALLQHPDPDSMTDAERAAYWEASYRKLVDEESVARITLAQHLKCPATWRYIIPEVVKRIQ